jgi:uncharacterized protein YtpQ (UPF0354 family)
LIRIGIPYYDTDMAAMSREQFIEQLFRFVPEKFPLVKMSRGDQPFSVRFNGNTVALENIYRVALLQPKEMRRAIERWVVELLRAAEGSPDRKGKFDDLKDRLLPIILPSKNTAAPELIVSQPLVEGLIVAYAIDSDRTISYLPRDQFDSWQMSLDDLHDTALTNLVDRSQTMVAQAAQDEQGQTNLILFQTGDGYDASRLLLPMLHDRLREHLNSPFAAAIPTRNVLLCFRNDETTVDHLEEQIIEGYRRMPDQVTDQLLLVTPDGIAPRL